MDAARAGRYGANMVLLALTAIGITLVIERDIRRRLLPSGRAEYGVLIASAILSVIIGARCANHRLRLCARRRWLRDRLRSRLPGDGAANVDHDIRPNFRHSNYLRCGISYVARPPRYRRT